MTFGFPNLPERDAGTLTHSVTPTDMVNRKWNSWYIYHTLGWCPAGGRPVRVTTRVEVGSGCSLSVRQVAGVPGLPSEIQYKYRHMALCLLTQDCLVYRAMCSQQDTAKQKQLLIRELTYISCNETHYARPEILPSLTLPLSMCTLDICTVCGYIIFTTVTVGVSRHSDDIVCLFVVVLRPSNI